MLGDEKYMKREFTSIGYSCFSGVVFPSAFVDLYETTRVQCAPILIHISPFSTGFFQLVLYQSWFFIQVELVFGSSWFLITVDFLFQLVFYLSWFLIQANFTNLWSAKSNCGLQGQRQLYHILPKVIPSHVSNPLFICRLTINQSGEVYRFQSL